MSRLDANVFHNGCVNTAKWYLSGEYLLTGSDDRTVKVHFQTKKFDYADHLNLNFRHLFTDLEFEFISFR